MVNFRSISPPSFTDFLNPFPLYRGRGSQKDLDDQVGSLKGAVCIYETPDVHMQSGLVLNRFPSNAPVDILVRVYIVEVGCAV